MRNVRLAAFLASQVILWLRLSLVFKIFPITANVRIGNPTESAIAASDRLLFPHVRTTADRTAGGGHAAGSTRMPDTNPDPSTAAPFVADPDPETGVRRFLLDPPGWGSPGRTYSGRVRVTDDGRYWWVSVYGPAGPALGVVDLLEGRFRAVVSTDTSLELAVDPRSGVAVVADGFDVIECDPDGDSRRIGRFDDGIDGATAVASGLTRSAGGERIGAILDCEAGWRIVSLYRPTSDLDVWHKRSTHADVAAFSPTDPRLLLVARSDDTVDKPGQCDAWLAREGLGARPIGDLLPDRHRGHWWGPAGDGLWCVEPGTGISYLDLELGRRRSVWSVPVREAHATADGSLLAATVVRNGRGRLVVYDPSVNASTDVAVVSGDRDGGFHPQFAVSDSYLTYTTVREGRPTVAATPVSALQERL